MQAHPDQSCPCPHVGSGACALRGPNGSRGSAHCHRTQHLRCLGRGTYLFRQGEECQAVHSVLRGVIALEYVDGSGNLSILRLVRSGETIGCTDLFQVREHHSSARAVEDALICSLPRGSVVDAIDGDGRFGLAVLKATSRESQAVRIFAQRMASLTVDDRILTLLEDLADGRDSFTLPVTKKDLASMAATIPEVLSRALVRLQKTGAIWMKGNLVAFPQTAPTTEMPRLAS